MAVNQNPGTLGTQYIAAAASNHFCSSWCHQGKDQDF